MDVRCPNGHLLARVTRDGTAWVLEIPVPDMNIMMLSDGTSGPVPRYPAREELTARPWRKLRCPRECRLENSWFTADSETLQRRASAGARMYRLGA